MRVFGFGVNRRAYTVVILLLILLFRHYLLISFYLLRTMTFKPYDIEDSVPDFDVTFARYERNQSELGVVQFTDGTPSKRFQFGLHSQTNTAKSETEKDTPQKLLDPPNLAADQRKSVATTEEKEIFHGIPPIIHQVLLAPATPRPEWTEATEKCRFYHPNYQFMVWDDERAAQFVDNEYPHLYNMWKSYKHPIQRADSIRYLILLKYGGFFLDLDLACRRSLEPLREFSFIAAGAHPVGISNGFIGVAPQHPLIKSAVENLKFFNRNWAFMPYPTVMFSTGCHYLSTILALHPLRSQFFVLFGRNHLHRLSGPAVTPLFRHLGSSSWHSFDAGLINSVGKPMQTLQRLGPFWSAFLITVPLAALICFFIKRHQRRSRYQNIEDYCKEPR